MPITPQVQDFVDKLSPDDRRNLLVGLTQRVRQESITNAAPIADLLASHLRVLGLNEEADTVAKILTRVRALRP